MAQSLRTVVLLPGIPGSRLFTHPSVRQRGHVPGWRLIVLERPGLGLSDPPPEPYTYTDFAADFRDFCGQLGLRRVSVIGFSAGTPFAIAVASCTPAPAATATGQTQAQPDAGVAAAATPAAPPAPGVPSAVGAAPAVGAPSTADASAEAADAAAVGSVPAATAEAGTRGAAGDLRKGESEVAQPPTARLTADEEAQPAAAGSAAATAADAQASADRDRDPAAAGAGASSASVAAESAESEASPSSAALAGTRPAEGRGGESEGEGKSGKTEAAEAEVEVKIEGVALVSAIGPPDTPNKRRGMALLFQVAYWAAAHAPWLVRRIVRSEAAAFRRRPVRALRDAFAPYSARADVEALRRPGVEELFLESAVELYGRGQEDAVHRENIMFAGRGGWGFDLSARHTRHVAIWQGGQDRGCTPAMAEHLAERMRSGTASEGGSETGGYRTVMLKVLPEQGHMLYFDVWEEVVAWVNRLGREGPGEGPAHMDGGVAVPQAAQ